MSCMFPVTNHLLAQLDSLRSWKETTAHKNDVHLFPVEHDVAVAKLLLPALWAVLTVFMQEHAVHDGWFSTGQLDEYGSVSRTCQGFDIGRYATSSERHWCGVLFQRLRDRSVHGCHRSLSVSLLREWHLCR